MAPLKNKEDILLELARAVVDMEEDTCRRSARESLGAGIEAAEAINGGLVKGMMVVGDKYEREEYFIPEVLLCSDAMLAGLAVLQPHLPVDRGGTAAKVVLGVVRGDTHDIGKSLVKIMLEAAGFEVYDLGRDVPPADFVTKALEVGASVIGLSTLMSTTMDGMRTVIEDLEARGIRDRFLVMVGGGPVSPAFAREIGADLYAPDANSAVRNLTALLEVWSCA